MSSHFRKLSLLLLTGLVTGFGCMGAFGQVASDLRGRIVDPSDAGIAAAQVVATDMNTGIARAVTSGAGWELCVSWIAAGTVSGCSDGGGSSHNCSAGGNDAGDRNDDRA